jgi:hypothetical protein
MIIWDTGVYEVLPGRSNKREPETETDSASESDMRSIHQSTPAPGTNGTGGPDKPTESEKLRQAFQNVYSSSIYVPSHNLITNT